MPDSPEYRISQLEQGHATVREQVVALRADVNRQERDIEAFAKQVVIQAELATKLDGMQRGLDAFRQDWRDDVEHFNAELVKVNTELDAARADRAQMRREMEDDRRDRERVREQREAKERERERAEGEKAAERAAQEKRDKWIRWTTLAALAISAIASTVAVINL